MEEPDTSDIPEITAIVPKEYMDRVLCYRNLLCVEDHLDEIVSGPVSGEDRELITKMRTQIEVVRSTLVMPEEKNKKWHCVAKHLSTAYEAAREVAKVTKSDSDRALVDALHLQLIIALEKLWDAKIEICGRCK